MIDAVLTIALPADTTSDTFSQVIGPFSQRVAAKTASPTGKVSGCTNGSGSQAPAAASSVAGRRLMVSITSQRRTPIGYLVGTSPILLEIQPHCLPPVT